MGLLLRSLKRFITYEEHINNETPDYVNFVKLMSSLPINKQYSPTDTRTTSHLIPFNSSIITNATEFWAYCNRFDVKKEQIQFFNDSDHTDILNFVISDFDYKRKIIYGYYEEVIRFITGEQLKTAVTNGDIIFPEGFDISSYDFIRVIISHLSIIVKILKLSCMQNQWVMVI